MARLSYGSGSVRVEMDDTLERLARRALHDVAPGLLDKIEETVERIEADALAKWPVRTGKSKAGLAHYVSITPAGDQVRGSLINTVKYSRYIKSNKNGLQGKSAMIELMRRPVEAAADVLAAELGDIATTKLGG